MTNPTPTSPALDEISRDFLQGELERLQTLYTHMDGSAQSVFNFYLTFVSTLVGAIIVLIQLGGSSAADGLRVRLSVMGLMFFGALVGAVYLSALSGRYGHMARYARGIDDLRRFLIREGQVRVPESFAPMLAQRPAAAQEPFWTWLFPSGTYQLFIGVINSTALALMTGLVLSFGTADGIGVGTVLFGTALVFLIAVLLFNIYAHWVIRGIVTRLNLQINTQDTLYGLAGRQ